jgi:hypothetical protein
MSGCGRLTGYRDECLDARREIAAAQYLPKRRDVGASSRAPPIIEAGLAPNAVSFLTLAGDCEARSACSTSRPDRDLHLCETAIHEQLDSSDVAAVVAPQCATSKQAKLCAIKSGGCFVLRTARSSAAAQSSRSGVSQLEGSKTGPLMPRCFHRVCQWSFPEPPIPGRIIVSAFIFR